MISEYTELDATALSQLVSAGKVSAEELLSSALEQNRKWNPHLNAVIFLMEEEARKTIRRGFSKDAPFAGVPFLIKDLGILYEGQPCTGSSKFLKNFVAPFDTEIMKRFRNQGLVTWGVTNTPEFGLMGITESKFRGACRNPWDLQRTPGGSSGGSAAAVAARIVPIAHGGDGGGSIRIPASACGLVGLKPSRGRTPLGPLESEAWMGLVVNHVLTRSVRDCATMLDGIQGTAEGNLFHAPAPEEKYSKVIQERPRGLKIAYTSQSIYGKNSDPECIRGLESALELCESLGHSIESVEPKLKKKELAEAYLTIVAVSLAADLNRISRELKLSLNASDFEATTWFLYVVGSHLSAQDVQEALLITHEATRELNQFFQKYDFFATPTLAYLPSPLGLMDLKLYEQWGLRFINQIPSRAVLRSILFQMADRGMEKTPNTQLFNQTGLPAISLPLHWTNDGIPVGIQFATAFGREDRLLALAAQLEEARPWADRKPELPRASATASPPSRFAPEMTMR